MSGIFGTGKFSVAFGHMSKFLVANMEFSQLEDVSVPQLTPTFQCFNSSLVLEIFLKRHLNWEGGSNFLSKDCLKETDYT